MQECGTWGKKKVSCLERCVWNAGVPLYNKLSLIFLQVQYKSHCLLDPSLEEEERVGERVGGASGHVTIVYLSSLDEVTSVRQNGCMLPDKLMMVSKNL